MQTPNTWKQKVNHDVRITLFQASLPFGSKQAVIEQAYPL